MCFELYRRNRSINKKGRHMGIEDLLNWAPMFLFLFQWNWRCFALHKMRSLKWKKCPSLLTSWHVFLRNTPDKGLIWIILSSKALLHTVETCSDGFTKHGGTTNVVFGDGYYQLYWIFLWKWPITLTILIVWKLVIKMKRWKNI